MFRKTAVPRKPSPESPSPNPFTGVWAAAVTPHRGHKFEADYAGMLELVDKLGRSGVDGIVLLGATGEFLNIQMDAAASPHWSGWVTPRSTPPSNSEEPL
jgi:hypothetical protein